jgi:hypothetical protein
VSTDTQRKGWITASGQPVKNKDDLVVLDKLLAAHPALVVR